MANKQYLWDTETKNNSTVNKVSTKKYLWDTEKTTGGTGGGRLAVKQPKQSVLSKIVNTALNARKLAGEGIVIWAEGTTNAGLQALSSGDNPITQLLTGKDTKEKLKGAAITTGKQLLKYASFNNPIYNYAVDQIKTPTNEKLKNLQQAAQTEIAKDKTAKTLDMLGWNTIQSNGKTIQQNLDDKSLIKSNNMGGQVVKSVGAMLPSIILGNTTGNQQVANAALGLNSYGSGVQQAYQNGATREQADKFGKLNAAVELGTEYITGGIPGVKNKWFSGLDNIVAKGLGKKSLEEVSKSVTKELIQAGYKIFGEAFEEALAEILQPLIQNATYTKGQKVNWDNVINSAIQGAIAGGLLEAPTNIGNMKQAINNKTQLKAQTITPQTQLQTPTQTNIQPSTITPTTPQTTQEEVVNKPQLDNVENNNVVSKGKEIFGTTNKFSEAGYITTDGELLDFSGKKDGGLANQRSIDHRDIAEAFDELNYNYEDGTDALDKFQRYGNIRLNPESQGMELAKMPTKQQFIKIYDFVNNYGGEVIVDFAGENTYSNPTSKEYKQGTSSTKIINDIKEFYKSKEPIETQPTQTMNKNTNEDIIKSQELEDKFQQGGEVGQRKFVKTAEKSGNLNKSTIKELQNINSDYIIQTDKKSLETANRRLQTNGTDGELQFLNTKFKNGERFNKDDMTTFQRLYQEAQVKGDTKTAASIIADLAVLGTEQGQNIQALSMINKLTPEGRLLSVERLINRENSKLTDKQRQKLGGDIEISQELKENILNSKNQTELDENVDKALTELGKKVPLTWSDRLRSWRYMSMLTNPRTHIRNIVANTAMKGVAGFKNKVSGAIEGIVNTFKPIERTKTIFRATKEQQAFAEQDSKTMRDRIQNNKYDTKGQGIIPKRAFDTKWLNVIAEGNSKALGWEDWLFSSKAYKNALANYMKANKYTAEFLSQETKASKEALEKGREIAIKEAQEQTFQQFNSFAQTLSRLENKNAVSKIAVGALIPFKKTPMNIAKTGYEYSPVRFVQSIFDFTTRLNSGKTTINEAIDGVSKGLTGTSIMLLGAFLASQGIIRASGSDDDKEEYFQENQGMQKYSIEVLGKSYTLDWLSPAAMPFFAGVEAYNLSTNKEDLNDSKLVSILDGMSQLLDPLTQMSMLQGINQSIQSYNKGLPGGTIGAVGLNFVQNYAGQFIPTISGQTARTIDSKRRSTTGEGKGIEKVLDTFVNKQIAKIPFASKTLEPYTDIYGREQKTGGVTERIFQNFISPGYLKDINITKVDKEIQKLYTNTGNKDILPSLPSRYFTKDGKKIYLTSAEYTNWNKTDGKTVLKGLEELFTSYEYREVDEEEKIKKIKAVYDAAREVAKQQYLNKKGIE